MAAKPSPLAVLERGKLIDAIPHFVETFNWMCAWIANFEVKKETGLTLDQTLSDHPKLQGAGTPNLVSGDDSNLKFTKTKANGKDAIAIDVYYV